MSLASIIKCSVMLWLWHFSLLTGFSLQFHWRDASVTDLPAFFATVTPDVIQRARWYMFLTFSPLSDSFPGPRKMISGAIGGELGKFLWPRTFIGLHPVPYKRNSVPLQTLPQPLFHFFLLASETFVTLLNFFFAAESYFLHILVLQWPQLVC